MSEKSYTTRLAPPAPVFIGIDLGTSGCRAMAIDQHGHIRARAKTSYPVDKTPGKTQQPMDWWLATKTVLHEIRQHVNSEHIHAISIDGTSSTVFLCNDAGKPLTPALMYSDHRAHEQAAMLAEYAPRKSIVLSPTSGLAKAMWLLENHSPQEKFHIVHQADWVAGLIGKTFDYSDINNCLKTGYDPVNGIWPVWVKDLFHDRGIPFTALPIVKDPGESFFRIHPHMASELELPLDTLIIAGTTDSTAAFLATGAKEIGDAVTSLGSTMVLKVIHHEPINDPHRGIYSQPLGKHWLVGGSSNSGGAVLKYFFSDEQMLELSQKINPAKPTGLDYYPLLDPGERFPVNDPKLQPKLTPRVEDDVIFFQALLEGIAEIEHRGYRLLEEAGTAYPTSVLTAGGGSINRTWHTIREQKLGVPVHVAHHAAAAYGSALLALKHYQQEE